VRLQIRLFFLFFLSLYRVFPAFSQESETFIKVLPDICLSETEELIFQKVNDYRIQHGLQPVHLSKSLTYVAQFHAWDLAVNYATSRRCNLHSWSSKGPWSACCYTEDHRHAECMWDKPRELTNYQGNGYEIAYWTNEPLSPSRFAEKTLIGWKQSHEHDRVILNRGEWSKIEWISMGVGYNNGYAVVWFGNLPDEEEEIHLCMN
jgi:hypothetical protein